MGYVKTLWKNRIVERPRTFRQQQNADGSVTLIPDEGQIIEAGTPVNAENLNKFENAFATHLEDDTSHVRYGIASGTNAKTITLNPVPTALVEGLALSFKNTTANNTAATLNVNGLGAKSILKSNGSALASGSLKAGGIYTVRYDGTSFILQGEGGEYGTAVAKDVAVGKTIGTENGLVNGTLVVINKAKGTTNSDASKVLTVRGLSFTPTTIITRTFFNEAYIQRTFTTEMQYSFLNKGRLKSLNGTTFLVDDGGLFTIYSDGFSVNVDYANASTEWLVF